jgi:transcriptional regulator with GAF, ATPase, and Fis domain
VITATGGRLDFQLPGHEPAAASPAAPVAASEEILTDAAIRELERQNLIAALDRTDWRVYGPGGAAELLGLKPTTVTSRMQRLGLKRAESR